VDYNFVNILMVEIYYFLSVLNTVLLCRV